MSKIYALTIKKTGEVLNPETFKKYWENYGGTSLRGWRPPKKMYYKEGHAKRGFAHIPDELKPHINITLFEAKQDIIDGEVLFKEQEERRIEREKEQKRAQAEYEKKRAEERYKQALEDLQKYE